MGKFKPVAHNTAFVRRVMKKPGVKEAYDALSEEYAYCYKPGRRLG